MRRLRALLFPFTLVLFLMMCGCTGTAEPDAPEPSSSVSVPLLSSCAQPESQTQPPEGPETKAVIVCFSHTGNTETLAQELKAQTGAELVMLIPAEPYPDDYDAVLSQAWEERENGVRPALEESIDVSGYDTVYLGSPVWWDDLPMIVRTFLDSADLSGKTVAPFFTSGSGDAEAAYEALLGAEPDAAVTQPLSLRSEQVEEAQRFVSEWLAALATAE